MHSAAQRRRRPSQPRPSEAGRSFIMHRPRSKRVIAWLRQLYGYNRTCRLRATQHGRAQISGSKSQDQAPGFRWWGTDRNGVHLQDRLPSALGNYWSARNGKDVRCRSNLNRRPNLGSFSKEKTPALRSDQWHHVHSIFRNWRNIAIALTTGSER